MNFALILVFLFPLALAQTDDCLTFSYGTKATQKVVALPASTFTGLTTSAAIESALESLYQIATSLSSPWVGNVYVGASNDDTYLVKNCLNQRGANAYCSSSGPQYIAYVRNTAYYGDTVRHVFGFAADGNVDILANTYNFSPENSTYNTTGRFWYKTLGWSGFEVFAAGGYGKTYSQAYGSNMVAAADRNNFEYCGPCLSNSYAVAATQALTLVDFSAAKAGITSSSGFTAVATAIKNTLDAIGSNYTVTGHIGFPNGDSYMVKYCNQLGGEGTSECSGHDYLFYVTNRAVYTDNVRRALAMSSDGTVGSLVSTLSAYDVTTRQWYQINSGWTDTYAFAAANITGRTYSLAINGGVAGTDRSDSEPCGRSVQACTTTSSASTVLVSFAALAASFLVFVN